MEDLLDISDRNNLNYTLNGIGVESYTWLLAYYFLQGDMNKAEYLWKRVPKQVKQRNPEFEAIWRVGNRLWEKDAAGFYQAVGAYQWTVLTSPIIDQLIESVREETITRIATAYPSIHTQDLATLLGLSVPEVEREVIPKTGWKLQDDGMLKISGGDGNIPIQFTNEGRDDIKKIIDLLYFIIALVVCLLINQVFW